MTATATETLPAVVKPQPAQLPAFVGKIPNMDAIEDIAAQCSLTKLDTFGKMQRAFILAQGIQQLNALITPAMMTSIIALQDSPLGFRTDKDPTVWDKKTNAYNKPYGLDVVKRCFVESLLRGAMPVGNEWNIIAGRLYLTKEFFERAVAEFPGVTDLRLEPGVPRMANGGAIVPFKCTWKRDGKPDSMSRDIPVRSNEGMGVDAILGKATRKMLAAVYRDLTGSTHSLPEGGVDDGPDVLSATAQPRIMPGADLGAGSAAVQPERKPNGAAKTGAKPDAPKTDAAAPAGGSAEGADAAPETPPFGTGDAEDSGAPGSQAAAPDATPDAGVVDDQQIAAMLEPLWDSLIKCQHSGAVSALQREWITRYVGQTAVIAAIKEACDRQRIAIQEAKAGR